MNPFKTVLVHDEAPDKEVHLGEGKNTSLGKKVSDMSDEEYHDWWMLRYHEGWGGD